MAPTTRATLKPGVQRRLAQLRKLARREAAFMALVDMYRNVDMAGETEAHFYAWRDWSLNGGKDGRFDVLGPGYDQRELEFLSRRGLTRPK